MSKVIALILTLFSLVLFPIAPIYAVDTLDNEYVCQRRPNAAVCQENTARNSGNPVFGEGSVLQTVFTWLLRITGAISVIMLIVGGLRYVLSGGDSNGVQSAKNTILYALVGLLVSAGAGLILRFVLGFLI